MILLRSAKMMCTAFQSAFGLASCDTEPTTCLPPTAYGAYEFVQGCVTASSDCFPGAYQGSDYHDQVVHVRFGIMSDCWKDAELKTVTPTDQGQDFVFRCEIDELIGEIRVSLFHNPVHGFNCGNARYAMFPNNADIPLGESVPPRRFGL